jgi:hypothetical protein
VGTSIWHYLSSPPRPLVSRPGVPLERKGLVWYRQSRAGFFVTPRTHHREKTDLPQNRVWNHLFPHSVLEGRSKKAGLGWSSKPKN